MNPNNEVHIKRLRDSMDHSRKRLMPFRQKHFELLKQYVGHHYGEHSKTDKTPVNMMKLAIDIYIRHVVAKAPSALVTTHNNSVKIRAYEFQLALNHLVKEIRLTQTLQEVAKSAMFSMGIVKIGITPMEHAEHPSSMHDAGQPYCDPVLIDDWLHDMTARRMGEWDWCGNRYRMPLDLVRSSKLFDRQQAEKLNASDNDTDMGKTEDSSHHLSQGKPFLEEEYRDHVELWDIWVPSENLVVTLADSSRISKPLRVVEWEGPERGPYPTLAYGTVPGNVMPVPPAMQLTDSSDLLNRLFLKLGRQAERQKTVTIASGHAQSDGTADRIMKSGDGDTIYTESPESVKEMRYGGIDQGNMAFAIFLKDITSYLGGNIDTLGGLSEQGSTLGQEKLLSQTSSQMMQDMQATTTDFTEGVLSDLGYYLYTDPLIELPLVKQVPNTDIEIPFNWGPDKREADFYEYNVKIQPHSLQSQGPGEKMNLINQIVQTTIVPLIPMMQQQGLSFNLEEYLSLMAKYSDLPELGDLIDIGGMPLETAPQMGQDMSMGKPPATSREYIRRNVPTGGTEQSRNHTMMQTLMGGGAQANPDQMAAMAR